VDAYPNDRDVQVFRGAIKKQWSRNLADLMMRMPCITLADRMIVLIVLCINNH